MLLALVLTGLVAAPPQVTGLRGRIVDARSGAPLGGARVVLVSLDGAATTLTTYTQADGSFELTAEAGAYDLTVSIVGYIFVRRRIDIPAGAPADFTIPLAEGAGTYEESVRVTAELEEDRSATRARTLGPAGLQELRGVATDDPMRAVHALPGVATGDDFQAAFSVRGSPFRHAGVTIDGLPAARLLHVVRAEANSGSISMINTDVLSSAALFAGARPARDGDWLGPTLAFELREGSRDRTGGRLALSGTSASIVLEGPVSSSRRGSWLVSLRKSYLDWLVRQVESGFDSTLGFWDGHVKGVLDTGGGHQLQFFAIGGDASYRERETSSANGLLLAGSGSTLVGLSWRHASPSWMQRHRVFFLGTEFRNTGAWTQELARGYTQELGWRGEAMRPLAGQWLFEAGGAAESLRANQIRRHYERGPSEEVAEAAHRDDTARARTMAGWIALRRQGAAGTLTIGVRAGGRTDVPGTAWSPWLLLDRRVGRFTLRAGGGASAQFADPLLTLADGEAPGIERARSADVGVVHELSSAVEWSVDAFLRHESNGLRAAADDRLDALTGERVAAPPLAGAVATLETRSRGVDVVIRRRAASGVTGWAGYSWARTRVRDAATGEAFDADFDQRHTLNLVVSARLSYRSAAGVKLRVGSNTPLGGYFARDGDELRLSSFRNRVRLPTYARLDARATRTFTFARRRLTVFVEVMNVLNRENVGPADPSVRASLQVTGFAERLIPRVPSAGFVVEF
jgi:hypothetical protein